MRGTSHINCSLRGLRGLRNVVTLKFTSKKGRPPSALLLSSPLSLSISSSPAKAATGGTEQRRRERESSARLLLPLRPHYPHRRPRSLSRPPSLSLLIPPSFLPSSKQPRSIDARPRPLRRRPRESPQHPTLRGGRGGGVREAGAVGSSRLVAVASLPARLPASE